MPERSLEEQLATCREAYDEICELNAQRFARVEELEATLEETLNELAVTHDRAEELEGELENQKHYATQYLARTQAEMQHVEELTLERNRFKRDNEGLRDLLYNEHASPYDGVVPGLRAAEKRIEELEWRIEEALRCLTLIGHVPRSKNTWADRCVAAAAALQSRVGL